MALQFMTFLLRHNWLGSASDELLVITTTDRKSGKRYFDVPVDAPEKALQNALASRNFVKLYPTG
jgi:hypothetical protein